MTQFYFRITNLNGPRLNRTVGYFFDAFSFIVRRHPRLAKAGKISYVDMSELRNMSVIHVKAGCKWYAIIEKSYTLHGP